MKPSLKTYQNILQFISKFSNIIYTFAQTLLTTIAIPVALAFVLAVEIPRVTLGVLAFDANPDHSTLTAAVIVIGLLVVEFIIHYLYIKYGVLESKKYKFSFGNFGQDLWYFLRGYPNNLEIREQYKKTPAYDYENLAVLLRRGIIIISIIGTLQPQIENIVELNPDLSWYEALIELVAKSDLNLFLDVVAGVLTAFLLVRISTSFARHVSIRAHEALQDIQQEIINSNVVDFYGLIERLNSRVLKKLTNLGESDKFIIDGKRVKFNDKWYNLNNASEKTSFVAVLKELNDERD